MEEGSGRGKRPCRATPTPATEADDQEQDMEKFYALLETIRAMRDLIRTNGNKRQKTESLPPLWRPTFELEDFKDGEEPVVAAESALDPSEEEEVRDQKEKDEVKKEENNYVDLSLSL